jgi:putative spermidine/putrescine transport system permease protein
MIVVDTLLDQFQWPLGSALALMLSLATAAAVLIFVSLTRVRWK